MSYCYSAVVITLSHSQRSLDKQGAIRLALLITAVFCLCWLPYNLVLLLDTLHDMNALSLDTCKSRDQMRQALMVTESLGYTHCCLNPLLYAFLGVRFRQDLCRLLASWGCPARACLSPQRDLARKVSISEAGPTTSSTLI
ncbi:CXCR5 protein, partial [Amia calva]|nr:CXCR5 protein [Amia calva]